MAMPFIPVKLELPSWEGYDLGLDLQGRKIRPASLINAVPEILSNSLACYVVARDLIDQGRFIDTPDFPKVGYISSRPQLVITNLHSFATNAQGGNYTWQIIDLPANQSFALRLSMTFFQADANKIGRLERRWIGQKNLLFMLDNRPLAEIYLTEDADSPDEFSTVYAPRTIYFTLRQQSNLQETAGALERLVRSK